MPLLLMLSMPVKAEIIEDETITEAYLFTFTNHMQPGATTGVDCSLDLGGETIDAYNEQNWGLGFGQTRKHTMWLVARYKNSFCGMSNLLLSGIGFRIDDALIGMAFGAVDGYEEEPQAVGTYFIKTRRVLILITEPDENEYVYHLAWSWQF
jgi:hypothetical protein